MAPLLAALAARGEIAGVLARYAHAAPAQLAALSAVAIRYGEGKTRPVCVPECLTRLVELARVKQYGGAGRLSADCAHRRGGALACAAVIQAAAADGLQVVEVDAVGAYNAVTHEAIRVGAARLGWPAAVAEAQLRLYARRIAIMAAGDLVAPPAGVGIPQGSPAAPLLFAAVTDGIAERVRKQVGDGGEAIDVLAYLDNLFVIGTPAATRLALSVLADASAGTGLTWKPIRMAREDATLPNVPIEVAALGVGEALQAKRAASAAALLQRSDGMSKQTRLILMRDVARAVLQYDSAAGVDTRDFDNAMAHEAATMLDVLPEVAALPLMWSGLGFVPHASRAAEAVLAQGLRALAAGGELGRLARVYAPKGAGDFFAAFAQHVNDRDGASFRANGTVRGLPLELSELTQKNLLGAYDAARTPAREVAAQFAHGKACAAATFGPGPLIRMTDLESVTAARLATATDACACCDKLTCAGCACTLCGKRTDAAHVRRCTRMSERRQSAHHRVVRAICEFIQSTNALSAAPDVHNGRSALIPDITIRGMLKVSLIEVKVYESRGICPSGQPIDWDAHARTQREKAIAKYRMAGNDPGRVRVAIFDPAGRTDGPTAALLRQLQRERKARGTWDGQERPCLKAVIGMALVQAEVECRGQLRTRVRAAPPPARAGPTLPADQATNTHHRTGSGANAAPAVPPGATPATRAGGRLALAMPPTPECG